MIRTIVAQVEHLEGFKPADIFENYAIVNCKLTIETKAHPVYSFVLPNGKVLGFIGGHILHKGVVEVFGLFSDELYNYPVAFHRASLKLLLDWFYNSKIHRMQVLVRLDYLRGLRWVERLGFTVEGILRQYGPDRNDYALYGMVI